MTTLAAAAALQFEDYDPGIVIRAVNELQPLDKERALDRIRSCQADSPLGRPLWGLFWVARVLFEMPVDPGYPVVQLGQPTMPPPPHPHELPRFPIVISHDVPLLATRGYYLGGMPEDIEAHLTLYRAHGAIRAQSLSPTASRESIEAAFLEQWNAGYGHRFVAEVLAIVTPQLDTFDRR